MNDKNVSVENYRRTSLTQRLGRSKVAATPSWKSIGIPHRQEPAVRNDNKSS